MSFIRDYLRSVLLSESELDILRGNQMQNLDTTKDITMALMPYGHTSSDSWSPTLSAESHQKALVVQASLNNLFTKQHFNICTVDRILEILQVSSKTPAYKQLHALHCVDYADMDSRLRAMLPSIVNQALLGNKSNVATSTAMSGLFEEASNRTQAD